VGSLVILGARRLARIFAHRFEFAFFAHFCARTADLMVDQHTGRNLEIIAKNKTQKFVDTEENGSDEVLH
jgi:hypothetical protein